MKKFTRYTLAMSALLIALPALAGCPDLASNEMSHFLCPVVGAANPFAKNTIVYKRPVNVLGALANTCSAISKSSGEKTYKGEEKQGSVVQGNIVCSYVIPKEWNRHIGLMNSLSIHTTVSSVGPLTVTASICPDLNYKDVATLVRGNSLPIAKIGSWKVVDEQVSDVKSYAIGSITLEALEPDGLLKGEISGSSKPFKHTCVYKYHSQLKGIFGKSESELELNGEMDLAILKDKNAAAHDDRRQRLGENPYVN